jgi:hypothetical protein
MKIQNVINRIKAAEKKVLEDAEKCKLKAKETEELNIYYEELVHRGRSLGLDDALRIIESELERAKNEDDI